MAHTFSIIGVGEGDVDKAGVRVGRLLQLLQTLGVPLAAGRAFTAEEERPGARMPVAIASYGVWRNAGSLAAFIGSIVRVNGTRFTVVGVAPRGFAGTMAHHVAAVVVSAGQLRRRRQRDGSSSARPG